MRTFILHASSAIPWQDRYRKAFADGLTRHGHRVDLPGYEEPGAIHVIFGPNVYRQVFISLRARGRHVLTVNRAFLGEVLGDQQNPYVAIGWDGYNNLARFAYDFGQELPLSRWRPEFDEHWKEPDPQIVMRPALVLGEYETPSWFAKKVRSELRNGPAWFRPHPAAADTAQMMRMMGTKPAPDTTLRRVLDASAFVLTHHTTAAVEALLRGLPVITYNDESMCHPITPHSIAEFFEAPRLPDRRREWAEWLAWTQWTIEEIARGDPFEFLLTREHG